MQDQQHTNADHITKGNRVSYSTPHVLTPKCKSRHTKFFRKTAFQICSKQEGQWQINDIGTMLSNMNVYKTQTHTKKKKSALEEV